MRLDMGVSAVVLQRAWENNDDLPHTVQRMNSIVASLSLTRFKLIAMADWPIMIVPM